MNDPTVYASGHNGAVATREYDPRAWAVWLLAGTVLTMSTRNPLYLLLLLAISRVVDAVCARPMSPRMLPFWRMSITIILFSVLFNMLMAHAGNTVLLRLPENWWLIGGPITLEAAVYGFVSGLSLVTLLSFFLAFSRIVPPHRLIQLAPRALHELGLVTLIALTFLPQTIQQQRRIREAQAIRGRQLNGFAGLRPVVIPLLVAALERSLNLAETMVSRGFGATQTRAQPGRARLLLVLALLLALGGSLWLAWGGVQGWLVVGAGLGVLALAYWLLARNVRHTQYRGQNWVWRDSLVVFAAVLPLLLLLLPGGIVDRTALAYAPYSAGLLPQFSVSLGLAVLAMAMPAVLELV